MCGWELVTPDVDRRQTSGVYILIRANKNIRKSPDNQVVGAPQDTKLGIRKLNYTYPNKLAKKFLNFFAPQHALLQRTRPEDTGQRRTALRRFLFKHKT